MTTQWTFGLIVILLLTACSPTSYVCTAGSLNGEYVLTASGHTYTIRLQDRASGTFQQETADPHSLHWAFVPPHDLVELNLETRTADVLSQMMGLERPKDAIVTERGVIALTPVCDAHGRATRLELSPDKGLEFTRK